MPWHLNMGCIFIEHHYHVQASCHWFLFTANCEVIYQQIKNQRSQGQKNGPFSHMTRARSTLTSKI